MIGGICRRSSPFRASENSEPHPMENLPAIAEKIHQALEARTQARDMALANARQVTRHAAQAIRAIHR